MFTVWFCLWFQRVWWIHQMRVSACCRTLDVCVLGLLPDLAHLTYLQVFRGRRHPSNEYKRRHCLHVMAPVCRRFSCSVRLGPLRLNAGKPDSRLHSPPSNTCFHVPTLLARVLRAWSSRRWWWRWGWWEMKSERCTSDERLFHSRPLRLQRCRYAFPPPEASLHTQSKTLFKTVKQNLLQNVVSCALPCFFIQERSKIQINSLGIKT